MQIEYLVVGSHIIIFLLAVYVLGAFHGQRASGKWCEFFANMMQRLTWRGFIWATAFPICWILLFYMFVAHVRFSLGRWPKFGQYLEGWLSAFYYEATMLVGLALVSSLCVIPVILIVCLCLREWRHVSFYITAYGAAVWMAMGAMLLAPHPFLNWFFD